MKQHAACWERPVIKVPIIFAVLLTSCGLHQPRLMRESTAAPATEITYVSTDLRHVAVFSGSSARFGPALALSAVWPVSPSRHFNTPDNIQCVSVGPLGNTEDFAIKRPIKAGDTYSCLTTSFRVSRCFEDCRAAVVERNAQLSGVGGDTLKSYMYVDSCLGVLIFSQSGNLAEAIPLNAEWLRGDVGILADPSYPRCRSILSHDRS